MQSQIEYELDILKNKNYDHARQFIEHLVNVLTRTSTAASSNANEINTIEQIENTHPYKMILFESWDDIPNDMAMSFFFKQ